MMAIDPHHPLIIEALQKVLKVDFNCSEVNMQIPDYDGTLYLMAGLSETLVALAMISTEIKSIGDAGGYEALDNYLQGFETEKAEQDRYVVMIDKSRLPVDPSSRVTAVNELAQKLSVIRTVFLSGPFFRGLAAAKQGSSVPPFQVNLRKQEKLWVICGDSRATFVFQIFYKDSNDASLSKIFLQEFQDAKKQINNAPAITFGTNVPEVISQFRPKLEGHFLTVTLLRDQITNSVEQAKFLTGFKQYLTYHMHCCKTYLHMRMRKRTDLLYGVFKQSVPEKLEEKVFKKTRATKAIKEESKIINNFKP